MSQTRPLWEQKGFLVFILLVLCFVASSTKLTSYDFWWHIKTGEIIAKTGEIPRKDIFSFTSYGSPRIAHEWLAELLFYLIFHRGGIPLMILFKAMLVCAAFLLIILYLMKQGVAPCIIGLCIVLSIWGARFRFSDRTELFTLLFSVLILFFLYDSKRSGSVWKLYSIIPLTLLWVNLHGGAILSPFFLMMFMVGEFFNRFFGGRSGRIHKRQNDDRSSFHLLVVLALVLLSTLINPNGIQIWKAPMEARIIQSSGLAVNTEWLSPDPLSFPLFYVGITIFFIVSALSIKNLDCSKFILTFFLFMMALLHLRVIGLFFLALPFFLSVHIPEMGLTSQGKAFFHNLFKSKGAGLLLLISLLFSFPAFLFHKGWQEFGFSMKEKRFPVEASNFLEKHYQGDYLYNDVKFGGYLIWRFYPQRKVFIDGRNEIYMSLVQRISKGLRDYREWLDLLKEYKIDAAMVGYWPRLKGVIYPPDSEMGVSRRGYRAYSAFLFLKKDWALVYWDDLTMIFFKRSRRNEPIIKKYEYRYVNPEDWRYLLSLSKKDEDLKENILEELSRRMREKPYCERAKVLYEKFKIIDKI